MSEFLRGVALSRRFFKELIEPLIAARFPGMRFAAAFVGSGSDVLGFETPMSMDHGWCARVNIFVTKEDHARRAAHVEAVLREQVPARFGGHPTTATSDRGEWFGVKFETVHAFLQRELGGLDFDPQNGI